MDDIITSAPPHRSSNCLHCSVVLESIHIGDWGILNADYKYQWLYYHGHISFLTCSWEASDCEGSRDFKTSSDPLRQYTDPCCCPLEEIPATLSKGNCRDFSLSSTTSRPCKNQPDDACVWNESLIADLHPHDGRSSNSSSIFMSYDTTRCTAKLI